MEAKIAHEELAFCLKLWGEQWHCEFWWHTKCEDCGAPYVLWKMASGDVVHKKESKRMKLQEWKEKFKKL